MLIKQIKIKFLEILFMVVSSKRGRSKNQGNGDNKNPIYWRDFQYLFLLLNIVISVYISMHSLNASKILDFLLNR